MKHLKIAILSLVFLLGCEDWFPTPPPDVKPDNFKILFYAKGMDSSSYNIYTVDSDGTNLTQHTVNPSAFPIWFQDKILYVDTHQKSLMYKAVTDSIDQATKMADLTENIMFLRYGKNTNSFLFSFYDIGVSQLGKMDLDIFEISKISQDSTDERLPMCNETDDWIYFSSKKNDTFDIYRKKIDGSSSEPVIVEDIFDVTTFSINKNGTFIVASKYNDQKSYIIVWDILHQKILYQLETTNMGRGLFPSFSKDDKYIMFTDGIPDNSSTPRNLFVMDFDCTNKNQITNFSDKICARPVSW